MCDRLRQAHLELTLSVERRSTIFDLDSCNLFLPSHPPWDYLSLVLENLDAPSRDTGCLYGARCHYRDGQPSPSFAAVDTAHPGDPLGAGVRFAI
jgi:hypothetical protein